VVRRTGRCGGPGVMNGLAIFDRCGFLRVVSAIFPLDDGLEPRPAKQLHPASRKFTKGILHLQKGGEMARCRNCGLAFAVVY
jgi:hypothetical protein